MDSHLKCNSWDAKASAGDLKPRHFRGVLLYEAAQASMVSGSMSLRFVFLGRKRRICPIAFSIPPFCQGLWVSQKYVAIPSWRLSL